MRAHSQASPSPARGERTSIAFRFTPEDDVDEFSAEEHPRVEQALRRACAFMKIDSVSLEFDPEEGCVLVDASNPTELAPSRVLHGVWTRSLENYRTDPRADGSLRWARGVLVDDGSSGGSPV